MMARMTKTATTTAATRALDRLGVALVPDAIGVATDGSLAAISVPR